MDQDEAESVIADWLGADNRTAYATYGYDVYLPTVIRWHVERTERTRDDNFIHERMGQWSPIFANAAWDLARRGVLRPGVKAHGQQSTEDGGAGYGFSVTPRGTAWLQERGQGIFVPTEPGRFSELVQPFRDRYGPGFYERAQEALRCYNAQAHLACCAMSGAAAESILLAVTIAKVGREEEVLELYRGAQGRSRVRNRLVGQAPARLQRDLDAFLSLLNYWRDEAAHGIASQLSDTEAVIALVTLIRFAMFVRDNWEQLVRNDV